MSSERSSVKDRLTGALRRLRAPAQVVVPPFVSTPAHAGEGLRVSAEYRDRPLSGILLSGAWLAARRSILFLPTLLAVVYYFAIASPRFVSEATFVVRTATKPIGGGGFGAILQMSGLTRAQDDVFSVHDFLTSRDAVDYLRRHLDVRAIYGIEGADFLARYPSIIYGKTWDEFYRYFQTKLNVSYSSVTGISNLQVQAFAASDAKEIAEALLVASEELVNKMNSRVQQDAIALAVAEVARNEERLLKVQLAITNFRNRELMIDPGASSLAVTELIGRLLGALSETRLQLREMSLSAPGNPQRAALEGRAEALAGQIQREKERISNDEDGLATKLAHYERLVTEREFAKAALSVSTGALETARSEARRQQLYLERIVQPNMPDYATRPERLRSVATIAALNILLLMTGWLVVTGVREHAQSAAKESR